MKLKSKIKIFESNMEDGIFSRNKKFYPSYFTKDDINKQFFEVKDNLGKKYGFDGKKVFQATQKNDINKVEYTDGKYVVIDESMMKKDDYWNEVIETDILIIDSKNKGIVIGNQMADCPILIVEDRNKGLTALSHCGAKYINRLLPKQTVEALVKEFKSNIEDIYVYVGSCAKSTSYVYDKYPDWASNQSVWQNNIVKMEDGYHIDMNNAIKKQLIDIGITNIYESPIDTITDSKYYSHAAARQGNKEKLGQNFVGFFYE